MQTQYKKLSLSLLLSCLIPGAATAEAELFGKANISFATLSDDVGSSRAIDSHSSRFGIKGDMATKGSLKIAYRFVWQVDMTDESKASNDHLKSREQYISLKDSWGEVRIGRHDTPYKKAGKKNVEFFSDSYADWNNIITKSHDKRADSSVSYYQTLGPAKLSIMYAAGADTPADDNAGEIISAAADMKFGDLALAIAYQDIAVGANPATTAAKIVFGYKLGATRVGVVAENIDETGAADKTNTMLSIKHQINDSNTVKFTYGDADVGVPVLNDPTMMALGIDHKLTDTASVFAYWADGADGGLVADANLVGDATVLAAGVIVKF